MWAPSGSTLMQAGQNNIPDIFCQASMEKGTILVCVVPAPLLLGRPPRLSRSLIKPFCLCSNFVIFSPDFNGLTVNSTVNLGRA